MDIRFTMRKRLDNLIALLDSKSDDELNDNDEIDELKKNGEEDDYLKEGKLNIIVAPYTNLSDDPEDITNETLTLSKATIVELNVAPIKIESSSDESDTNSNVKHKQDECYSRPIDPLNFKIEEFELKKSHDKGFNETNSDTDEDEIPLKNLKNNFHNVTTIADNNKPRKKYSCNLCLKSYSKRYALLRHTASFHEKLRPHICDICRKSFTLLEYLKIHKRTHNTEIIATCEYDGCNKSFSNIQYYKSHLQSHSTIRAFTCEVCGTSFRYRNNMVLHRKKHLGIKPFKCKDCGKSFVEAFELKAHERTHTTIRPHKCDICGFGFLKSWKLKRHMSSHTDIKPFKCLGCNKEFKRKEYLTKHIGSCNTSGKLKFAK